MKNKKKYDWGFIILVIIALLFFGQLIVRCAIMH